MTYWFHAKLACNRPRGNDQTSTVDDIISRGKNHASCLLFPALPPPLARWHAQPPAPLLSTPSCYAAQSSTMGFNDSAVGRYFKMDERKHITM